MAYGAGGNNGTIDGNLVYNIGQSGQSDGLLDGLYLAQTGMTVTNNVVYTVTGHGIASWHDVNTLTIMNNTIDHANHGVDVGADVSFGVNDHSVVGNNIVVNCQVGINEVSGTTGPNNVYYNNLLFGDVVASSLQNGLVAVRTVVSDPMFRNESGHDYHVMFGSPAIYVGSPTNVPAADFDGVRRPQDLGHVIGAYDRSADWFLGYDKPSLLRG